jgi:hypothetical protein
MWDEDVDKGTDASALEWETDHPLQSLRAFLAAATRNFGNIVGVLDQNVLVKN